MHANFFQISSLPPGHTSRVFEGSCTLLLVPIVHDTAESAHERANAQPNPLPSFPPLSPSALGCRWKCRAFLTGRTYLCSCGALYVSRQREGCHVSPQGWKQYLPPKHRQHYVVLLFGQDSDSPGYIIVTSLCSRRDKSILSRILQQT